MLNDIFYPFERIHTIEPDRLVNSAPISRLSGQARRSDSNPKGVLRFDSSEHLGVVREVNEHLESFLLIEWSYNPNLKSYVFGDRIDLLGAACPMPVAAVRFAAQPAQRLILTPGPDLGSSA